jgi:hypothetical protein
MDLLITPELTKAIGDELKKSLIQEMRRTKSIATGDLIKSLNIEIEKTSDGAIISLASNDYITFIEKGRKRGKYAPVKDLERWVRAKGIASDQKKVTSIAFAINNKINQVIQIVLTFEEITFIPSFIPLLKCNVCSKCDNQKENDKPNKCPQWKLYSFCRNWFRTHHKIGRAHV